jgi:hypothetical protein
MLSPPYGLFVSVGAATGEIKINEPNTDPQRRLQKQKRLKRTSSQAQMKACDRLNTIIVKKYQELQMEDNPHYQNVEP